MAYMPDYKTAREQAGFNWHVGMDQTSVTKIVGVSMKEFYLDPSACIEAYKRGPQLIRDMFGGDGINPRQVTLPAFVYGHANVLGCGLNFPDDGEVRFEPIHRSLDEWIKALQDPVDYVSEGMIPFYLDYWRKVQDAFPQQRVPFHYGYEGPITTAWILRGDDFFTDIYDEPEKTKHFLSLVVKSTLDFVAFLAEVNNVPAFSPDGTGMADDVASLMPPNKWEEFVVPYWEMYFSGLSSGIRHGHCENLTPAHLKFLEAAKLNTYDPSIAPKLNPRLLADGCRVPFFWLLGSFHYSYLSCDEVRDFVYQSAADGASTIWTDIYGVMCEAETAPKVRAFIDAAREVEAMLGSGATREDVGNQVSPAGRERFWSGWPE